MRRILLTIALLAGFAASASAQGQGLKLSFSNGLVTVDATSVPIRTILTEWSRVGGTKVVGADRVSGAPLTLKLVDVPEAKALEVILRSVAGYMAAPRSIAAAGPSMYDRIMVMATTSAPPPAAANNRPGPQQPNSAFSGTQRFVPPQRVRVEDMTEPLQQEEMPDENAPNPPVFTFPQPGQQNGFAQPGGFQPPQQFNGAASPGQNVITVNPALGNTPQGITINPSTQPGQPTAPGMPVGVSQPGMMVQPPPPQPGVRPPGQRQQ